MIFVDASAIVAMLCNEEAANRIGRVIDSGHPLCTSPVAILEATLAMVHRLGIPPDTAGAEVKELVNRGAMVVASVDMTVFDNALDAFARYGKGRHRAKLNMGDCFAYAVAKSCNAAILFVGDDFTHTDLRDALAANT